MVVECPADPLFVPLGARFGNVVQQRSPAQHQFVGHRGHVVEYSHGVVEIVFVSAAVNCVYTFECRQFRKISFSSPLLSSSFQPIDGLGEDIILLISVHIRSVVIISIR